MTVLNWLRRRGKHPDGARDAGRAALVERVTRLCPYVRLVSGYRKRLVPALAIADRYVRDVLAGLPPASAASEATWNSDPYIHAFFGTAQDVMPVFSRSPDLRDYFGSSSAAAEAYCVLGMDKHERRTLGVALEGDVMRTEVPQTTVSFTDHRVRICAATEAALREEIASRMLDQLALQALADVASGTSRRDRIEHEQTLLTTRLHLLEKQGFGMRSVLGESSDTQPGESERLREQVAQNEAALAALGAAGAQGGRAGMPERQLQVLVDVLTHAEASFTVEREAVRLSPMNIVLPPGSAGPGAELQLMTARVPGDPPLVRTFALVCVSRAGMLSPMQLLDDAARML
ncbi:MULTISPECIES: hypothetical protein [unclassified Cupriavidus]|uniref:hypothetical protein n=1 Tax=unclassified Cupriavidus TaxID=2640874 RepID=UPI001AE3FB3B|nr:MULTISPECIES: hypothetical protein [unclassified Cupriavidus]MBP0628211.1 hypothetical protein [Cupriavidus sp. AcVe19-1a]MBP0636214.1 hypothetical protein [Cupriavidus sp. AcVe19-6a]